MKKKINNFFTLKRSANGGFTLVELVVVIAILAILAGAAVPAYSGYINKANEAADQQLLAAMNTAYASACAAEGETHIGRGDVPTTIQLANGNVPDTLIGDPAINGNFNLFFEGGQFKRFDKLLFNSTLGVFTENSVAAFVQIVKDAWNGSSFGSAADGGEAALEDISNAFDLIGNYFGTRGFSLDELLKDAPQEVRDAFGFGTFDLEIEDILEKYCPEYAALNSVDKAAWIAKNGTTVDIIKGNAYVLHMAEDAAGRSAETVTNDVMNLIGAVKTNVTSNDIIAYYNKLNPDNTTQDINVARAALQLSYAGNVAVPAEMIVAVGSSGVQNTSGVSALGSMYALTAGFYNSGMTSNTPSGSYADFSTVQQAMLDPNFNEYLATKGQSDINAYLNYMNYVSNGEVDMDSNEAFAFLGDDIWELIAGSN